VKGLNEFLKLIAMLKMAYENLLTLHHNVIGCEWFPTHEKLLDYYEMIGDMSDDVAEIGIALGYKEMTIVDALTCAAALPVADRDARTSLIEARSIFNSIMVQLASAEASLGPQYADVVNKLQEYRETLRKEADYKLLRATSGPAPTPPQPVTPIPPVEDDDNDMM
jgi:DNA-binding ferritin-like protein